MLLRENYTAEHILRLREETGADPSILERTVCEVNRMLVFLDSNIICADYKMKSPSFEVAQKVGTIVLGQIVVDEVRNKYRENLEERQQKQEKQFWS